MPPIIAIQRNFGAAAGGDFENRAIAVLSLLILRYLCHRIEGYVLVFSLTGRDFVFALRSRQEFFYLFSRRGGVRRFLALPRMAATFMIRSTLGGFANIVLIHVAGLCAAAFSDGSPHADQLRRGTERAAARPRSRLRRDRRSSLRGQARARLAR